jgi:hypothetical protein
MATTSKTTATNENDTPRTSTTGIGSPITNDAYNVVTALHSKLKGLEAYRKFAGDGDREIWKKLTETDAKTVELLCDELERLVRDGKFRMGQPGRGNA